MVTETATIPGYTIDEATRTQTVVVNPNDTQTLHFTNTPSTTLVIEKYIEGTTTPLKGVTFLVTDSSVQWLVIPTASLSPTKMAALSSMT